MTQPPKTSPQRGLKGYLGNSAWLMGDSLMTNFFTFVVLAFVARYLGPEEYGAYAYVFSIAQLFAVLGQMGLDGLLTRDLVENPQDQAGVLGTAGGLRFLGYALGAVLCLIYAFAMPGHTATELWLFASAFVFILLTPGPMILENWFRSRLEARYSSIARMTGTLISGLLKIGMVVVGMGVVAVGFAQAASVLFIFLVSLPLFLSRGGPSPRQWRFSSERARGMLNESWLVFLGSIMAMIYLRTGQVMLRWWEGAEVVGIYSIAARMSEVFYFIPAALVTTFFPRLIQLKKVSDDIFNDRLQSLFALLALLAYATLIGIFLLGPFLINLAFGADYAAAVPILMVQMLAMPFIFQRYAFSRWILIERCVKISVMTQGAGAVVNVLLNLILIPRYGMMGAAVAAVFSYACASYFALYFIPRTRPVFMMMTRALFMPWKALSFVRALKSGKAG